VETGEGTVRGASLIECFRGERILQGADRLLLYWGEGKERDKYLAF